MTYNAAATTPIYEESSEAAGLASSSLVALETSMHSLLEMTAPQSRYFRGMHDEREKVIKCLVKNDDGDLTKRIRRVASCCAIPHVMKTEANKPILVVGRCRDRMCPRCSRINAMQCAEKLQNIMMRMPTCRAITLSIKSSDLSLSDSIDKLMKDWANVRRHRVWKEHVDGGIYSLEVTRNEQTGQWHPHLHVIVEGRYFDQKTLAATWFSVTGDSPVVYIQAVNNRAKISQYLSKYVTKPDVVCSWPDDVLWEYMQSIKGRRLFHTFGVLHNVKCVPEREKIVQANGSGYVGIGALINGYRESLPECIELFEYLKLASRSWRLAFNIPDSNDHHTHGDNDSFDHEHLDRLLDCASRVIRVGRLPERMILRPPPTLFDNEDAPTDCHPPDASA